VRTATLAAAVAAVIALRALGALLAANDLLAVGPLRALSGLRSLGGARPLSGPRALSGLRSLGGARPLSGPRALSGLRSLGARRTLTGLPTLTGPWPLGAARTWGPGVAYVPVSVTLGLTPDYVITGLLGRLRRDELVDALLTVASVFGGHALTVGTCSAECALVRDRTRRFRRRRRGRGDRQATERHGGGQSQRVQSDRGFSRSSFSAVIQFGHLH
jgi:hypothetical protein